ncbi:LemA family protein, partial [Acinetobacter sp. LH3_13]|uniref:LemA family protein n=1 Tax=Acinetobacter sp. LH3_13 TaxID=3434463 RepID=UPI003EBF4EF6
VQLEGTENRITVARQKYIDAVRGYNTTVRSFPTNLTAKLFDFQVKPNFTANEQAMEGPPTVDFGGGAAGGGNAAGGAPGAGGRPMAAAG